MNCASCVAMDRPQVTAHLCMRPAWRRPPVSAESFLVPEPQPVVLLPTWLTLGLRWWVLFCRNANLCFALRALGHETPVVNSKLITGLRRKFLGRHDFMSLS